MKPLTSESLQHHLTEVILSYWSSRMPDDTNGGFYGRIDGHDVLHAESDKSIILNTRILWTYSAAYRKLHDDSYLELARRAYEYIAVHFTDTKNGGVYWIVDFRGKPVERKKQVYAQSFAIYGLSEYYHATGEEKARDQAIGLFRLIETHAWDTEYGGYIEALDERWHRLEDMRLSDKDLNAPKSMNTHLHILEAYTNLYRTWQNDELQQSLRRLILLMCEKFVRPDGHFNLFFSMDWQSQSAEVSYGHDIEGSWLLWEALEVLGDKELTASFRSMVLRMVSAALEGMDDDGGLMNDGEDGIVKDTDKHWWPQAEALVGLVNAWQITGEDFYIGKANKVWQFIQSELVDHEHGEWFWRVDRDGRVNYTEDKAGPWKCPYHNGRALLELIERL